MASTLSTHPVPPPRTTAPPPTAPAEPGLRAGAIGFASNVAIGVASTAPAYSLAATLGLLVAVTGVGVHAPAVLIVSFVPMFCISLAYRALNRIDPDCGTTFAWVTRALGPRLGWVSGFAVLGRGRDRDGDALGDRGQVPVPARRLAGRRPLDDRAHARRGRVHRGDDLDRVPRR